MWEDPLRIRRSKHKDSIKEEFRGELPSFVQNVLLADCFSNMALAVIGEGNKISYDVSVSFSQVQGYVDFFDMLAKVGFALDVPFTSLLQFQFSKEPCKYETFLHHLKLFKEANIYPIFNKLIQDQEILTLTLGAFEAKLVKGFSDDKVEERSRALSVILDYIESYAAESRDSAEDYAENMMTAFYESAVSINSDLLTLSECNCFRGVLFSDSFMKILSEHIQWLKLGYFTVMYGVD